MTQRNWWTASIMPPEDQATYTGWSPCITWCGEQFGDKAIDGWWYVGEGVFKFRDERDYALFLLRWA